MAFNGAGLFVRLYNWVSDAAAAINITASRMDGEMDGFAAGLSNCITRDGQGKPSAAIDWNGQNLSNVNGLTTTGNTTLGDATTDTLNVGNGGLFKDAAGNTGFGGAANAGYRVDVSGTIRSAGGETSAAGYGVRVLNATANGGGSLTAGAGAGGGLSITSDGGSLRLNTNSADRVVIDVSGNAATGIDNTQTLGTAAKRWSVVYAGTGSINTSDASEKTVITPLSAAEIAASRALAAEIGTFQFLNSIADKGSSARVHIGMTVQQAIEIMQANGLDPMRYGFICYDEWPQQVIARPVKIVDTAAQAIELVGGESRADVAEEVVTTAGNRYGFRPDELMFFIARGFQARLAALEAR